MERKHLYVVIILGTLFLTGVYGAHSIGCHSGSRSALGHPTEDLPTGNYEVLWVTTTPFEDDETLPEYLVLLLRDESGNVRFAKIWLPQFTVFGKDSSGRSFISGPLNMANFYQQGKQLICPGDLIHIKHGYAIAFYHPDGYWITIERQTMYSENCSCFG